MQSDTLTAPPRSNIRRKAALNAIRSAWIAGLISAALTSVVIGSALLRVPFEWRHLLVFGDTFIALVLCYGIYRKSRIAALLMLAFFLWGKYGQFAATGTVPGWPVALVFTYFFARGVIGTFVYHASGNDRDNSELSSSSQSEVPASTPGAIAPKASSSARTGGIVGLVAGLAGLQFLAPVLS